MDMRQKHAEYIQKQPGLAGQEMAFQVRSPTMVTPKRRPLPIE